MSRPDRLVVVTGTATEVGKTWVGCAVLQALGARGLRVAARKPAQSFAAADLDAGAPTDADLLATATGENPEEVCPPARWYPLPLAPPMAAERLGRPTIALADLLDELQWPQGVAVGLVEAAGGARSPIADDADAVALARALAADLVVVVADAGLGTINAVRAAVDDLAPLPTVVLLNHFDPADELHEANRRWLAERDGYTVLTDATDLVRLLAPPPAPERSGAPRPADRLEDVPQRTVGPVDG